VRNGMLACRSIQFLVAASMLSLMAAGPAASQTLPSSTANSAVEAKDSSASKAPTRMSDAYGRLPLYFEANRGQTDDRVKFVSRGPRSNLFLTSTEAVLVLVQPNSQTSDRPEQRGATRVALRMAFVSANPQPAVTGHDELPGKINYFVGSDRTKWRPNTPAYTKVRYEGIYPGIDVAYYGNQRQLEYDLIVAPRANPDSIALSVQGADAIALDETGDLVLDTALGSVRMHKPFVYQDVDGVRQEIAGGYVLKGAHQIAFKVGAYDIRRPLVIDPVLFYSTYVGGSGGEAARAIAVDASGNAYITGETVSVDYPTIAGSFDTSFHGGSVFGDAFVTKLNPTGSALVYSTYLGGTGEDQGLGIVVDASGNAYVTGRTSSTNFPVTAGAFELAYAGGADDAFVTKVNPAGSGLVYSTYLGGNQQDIASGIAVDSLLNAYVVGTTVSLNFPTTVGSLHPAYLGGSSDAFVTKLNSLGTTLVYSTFLGGDLSDFGFGIAVNVAGNAHVTGQTNSLGIATASAFQTTFGGVIDAYAAKLNAAGTGLDYLSYLGGTGVDAGYGVTVDASNNLYVTGQTESTNFPTTSGAFDTSLGGALDAFVTKINSTGSAAAYSTYLGGSDNDAGTSIAVDASSTAYVAGATLSTDFPTMNAFQASYGGGFFDAFVTRVNAIGSALVYSSYLGGSGFDQGFGIAVDSFPIPNAYVAGATGSGNFPTTAGAFQTTLAGPTDAFVVKISDGVAPPLITAGKVTGGGTINVSGGTANFGFIVYADSASGPIGGNLQYVNKASGAKVRSVTFTTLVISGNMATFGGTCTNNGASCTFEVTVGDDGEPGFNDTFTISINGGPPEGTSGTLRSGNVQIH